MKIIKLTFTKGGKWPVPVDMKADVVICPRCKTFKAEKTELPGYYCPICFSIFILPEYVDLFNEFVKTHNQGEK